MRRARVVCLLVVAVACSNPGDPWRPHADKGLEFVRDLATTIESIRTTEDLRRATPRLRDLEGRLTRLQQALENLVRKHGDEPDDLLHPLARSEHAGSLDRAWYRFSRARRALPPRVRKALDKQLGRLPGRCFYLGLLPL